jgi:hypothetical protein
MTQTTPDASSGPVFVASAQSNSLCRIFGSLQPIHDIKHLVNMKKYEKLYLWPKRSIWRHLGPFSSSRLPFLFTSRFS